MSQMPWPPWTLPSFGGCKVSMEAGGPVPGEWEPKAWGSFHRTMPGPSGLSTLTRWPWWMYGRVGWVGIPGGQTLYLTMPQCPSWAGYAQLSPHTLLCAVLQPSACRGTRRLSSVRTTWKVRPPRVSAGSSCFLIPDKLACPTLPPLIPPWASVPSAPPWRGGYALDPGL